MNFGFTENLIAAEIIRESVEDKQTKKILEIMKQCKTLEEAIEKVNALLKK